VRGTSLISILSPSHIALHLDRNSREVVTRLPLNILAHHLRDTRLPTPIHSVDHIVNHLHRHDNSVLSRLLLAVFILVGFLAAHWLRGLKSRRRGAVASDRGPLSLSLGGLDGLHEVHLLHGEDEFAVDLADGDGDAHVGLVEDGVGGDGGESGCKEEGSCDGVLVVGGSAGLGLADLSLTGLCLTCLALSSLDLATLNLALDLPPESITAAPSDSSSSATKVTSSTAGIL
jgi:hypothetical protein